MLNFAQFRLVSFDCYGTLIDWETGIFSALRPILAAHGKTIADAELLRLYSELESEAEQGEFHPYREVLQSVVRGFGERLGFNPTESEARSLPESLPNWPPFADTIAALGKLKTALPACGHLQRRRRSLRPHGPPPASTFRLRDHRPASPRVQTVSPDVQNRATTHRRSASQWLHVAQSVYHDVIPARSLGISTVWVNRPSSRPGSGAAKAATGQARPRSP